MFSLVALVVVAAAEPAVKQLPPVKEPDWTVWKVKDPEAGRRAAAAWDVLRKHRPDQEYENSEQRHKAVEKVDAAYKMLDANPNAACATGAALLRSAEDDWERIMIATTVSQLGGEKGEPFLLWTMATCKTVDEAFEPVYDIASRLAAKRRPEYLPAVFLILRVRNAHIYLRLHAWHIRTHECLFYVLGRYGREVIPYVRAMLRHEDPYVRRNAAIVLGFFMDNASRPALIEMLKANDVGSGGAAFALGELGADEAVKPIARLLQNPDARTRFWAAYALYEIGSKAALPALEKAVPLEKDDNNRREMELAIRYIRSDPKPLGAGTPKLDEARLREALEASEKAHGLTGDIEAIAASAGSADLAQLERIRLKSMDVPSDKGNKWFQRWTLVIKTVRRRVDD